MSNLYAPLLEPLRLGGKTAPSRIVFAAHPTNFGRRNRFEDRHAAYYAARAAGGAGVIILEGSVVHPSDWPYEYAIFGYDEAVIAGYRRMAEAIKPHGALALAQLSHSGMQGTSHYSQSALWGPSPVPEVNSREVPKEMEPEDIEAVIEGFARAAGYALAGGLHGVEINAGPDSLVRQFMSPLTNLRQDEYGGARENRLRLAREVLRAVRRAVGSEAIVGLRISGDEHAPWAGLKPEDAAEIAGLLTADHQIDYVSVTSGSIYSLHLTRAGLFMPPGYALHLAAEVKAAVAVPVFAQGSIVDPRQASAILVEGHADAVKMTRALIADPQLPRKVRAGRADAVRQCVLCNQDCVVTLVQNPRLSCAINPAAGHEAHAEFAP
ncbi:MAG: 2,4-dienoyl-CoA reductase, partial [Chloroflexales bacterium]|nr:2,4-dienoyl-CoA reductase [Chloroflexales bacterium]